MHPIREQFIKDMQAGGLAEATQEHYLNNVDLFFRATWQNPNTVTEQMVKDFMREVRAREVARETFRGYLYALKFFFLTTMRRDWPSLKKTRFARPTNSV